MAEIVAVMSGGQLVDTDKAIAPIKGNIKRGKEAQKAYHGIWNTNLAFASGQQWSVWSERTRSLRRIQDMDPKYQDRELYTADIITENRLAVLGEMGSDDDRPELLLRRDDQSSEDFQAQVNRAVSYGWDHEWKGDEVLAEVDRLTIDLGTAAVRCRFDPQVGPVAYENVPHQNGQPVPSSQAFSQIAEAMQSGTPPPFEYKNVPAGRICWDPVSAFGLIPPAGVAHEKYFPFDCIVQPMPLTTIKAQFPETASDLKEDSDIGSTLGETTVGAPGAGAEPMRKGQLRGHVWLYTYFERPTPMNQKGRVFYFAGNDLKLLAMRDSLPYIEPDGTYCAGIAYFHWWRVTGRFFSRSLIEAMKDGQRAKNKRRTQVNEIIDRGMPKVFMAEGSASKARTSDPLEIIRVPPGEGQPTMFPGFGPGDWMYKEDEQIDKDLRSATGVTEPTLGMNPASVTNYSQLSLLREQSQVKRQAVYLERKLAIAKLVEFSVYDIRKYWGESKQIMLAGDDDRMEVEDFNANRIPTFCIVRVPKGATKPRSQSAELQKVQDIWTAAAASGLILRDPDAWVNWYKASQEHGQPLDLPDSPADDQTQLAEFENHLLMQGVPVQAQYWHPAEVHIPRHRQAQTQAEADGDQGSYNRIEAHIQAHLQEAVKASAAMQAGGPPGQEPAQPPSPDQAAAPGNLAPGAPPQLSDTVGQMQDAARMQKMF